jgi:hypothetical protein
VDVTSGEHLLVREAQVDKTCASGVFVNICLTILHIFLLFSNDIKIIVHLHFIKKQHR